MLRLGAAGARLALGWGAVEAVTATLPRLRGDAWEAVRRLAAAGPPAEEVGLKRYGPPASTGPARPTARRADASVPAPSVEGVG